MGDTPTAGQPPPPRHLTQDDLASRWRISERTLETLAMAATGAQLFKNWRKVVNRL